MKLITEIKSLHLALIASLFLWACQSDQMEELSLQEECQLTSQIPVSIIYERFDVNPQKGIISCYHIPLLVTPSDTTSCIYQFDKELLFNEFGFYFLGINQPYKTRLFGAQILAPVWSPDGNWLLWSNNENLFKAPYEGDTLNYDRVSRLTSDSAILEYPKWSPDQQRIMFRSRTAPSRSFYNETGLYVMEEDGSNPGYLGFDAQESAWANSSELFSVAGSTLNIFDLESNTQEMVFQFPSGMTSIRNLKVNPHNQLLYFIAKDQYDANLSLYRFDAQNSSYTKIFGQPMLDFGFLSESEIVLLYIKDQITQIALFDLKANFFETLYSYEEI